MGYKLPSMAKLLSGTNPPASGGNVRSDPVPQQIMAMYNRMDEHQYSAIKAQFQAQPWFDECLTPDTSLEPGYRKCYEVFCTEMINMRQHHYYPFCSWDCKDWDEQIKRR